MFTWWRWAAQLHFLSVCHLGADAVRSFINVFVVTLQNFKNCLFTIGTFLKHVLFVGTKRPSHITESAFSGWWLTVQCSISKAHKASQNGSIVTLLNLAPLTYSLKKKQRNWVLNKGSRHFLFQLSDFLNRIDSRLIKVPHHTLQLAAESSITPKRLNFQIYS